MDQLKNGLRIHLAAAPRVPLIYPYVPTTESTIKPKHPPKPPDGVSGRTQPDVVEALQSDDKVTPTAAQPSLTNLTASAVVQLVGVKRAVACFTGTCVERMD